MRFTQSTIAQRISEIFRENRAYDTCRLGWYKWCFDCCKWEPIASVLLLSEIQCECDRLMPAGYSAAFIRGVEFLLRARMADRLRADQVAIAACQTVRLVGRLEVSR